MNGPAWDKVRELTKDYPPEFNAKAAHDLVLAAWQMGFNLMRDPEAHNRYLEDLNHQNNQHSQATGFDVGLSNQHLLNAMKPRSSGST